MRYLALLIIRTLLRPLTRYASLDPANTDNIIDRISMTVIYTCAILAIPIVLVQVW